MTSVLHYDSPCGTFEIAGTDQGLRRVRLLEGVARSTSIPTRPAPPLAHPVQQAARQLKAYFLRQRTTFDLPIEWERDAPAFYRQVWELLQTIPYGTTTTYQAIADQLGDPKRLRAVGQANRHNPIAIIVPCHRVIAKNGNLQGYFYGLDMKHRLLALENPDTFAEQGALF